ncbi:hypothetical protein AcW1_002010 [Taiwanofungus camphoratus]|nr:hypothetical protein AcV5_010006 [Antrodia cinnamomea]KAI0944255.1 hypothetical protein AcW1_002010 [Antrodia cinnamomea]
MHLSNSCYAGKLDAARLKHALKCFPTFFRAGGWMPLGGTHYNFVREIPILSRYEIRLSVASWDNKWMYIVARFVSRPSISSKSKSKSKRQTHRPPSSLSSTSSTISLSHLPTPPADGTPCPIIHVSEAPLTPPTPTSPTYPKTLGSPFALTSLSDESKAGTKEEAQAQALAAALRAHEEPDGATLHCVAVSTVCFKMGRITVPPALVIASDGFSVGPEASAKANAEGNGYANGDAKAPVLKPYSHSNPPPHWKHVLQLRGSDWTLNNTKSPSGPLRTLRDFFVGGWRNIPEGARWWEDALSGAVERQRARGMEVVIELRRAMDGLRML